MSSSQGSQGSLALDWFSIQSRRIDPLDAQQQTAAQNKHEFQSELAAAQQDQEQHDQNGQRYKSAVVSSESLISEDITKATSIPTRKQLLHALHSIKNSKAVISQRGQSPSPNSAQLARIVYATYALALQGLYDEAERLQDASWYWRTIEDSSWTTSLYLLQTFPARLVLLGNETYKVLKSTATSATSSQSSSPPAINSETLLATVRQLRKTPNAVLGALWPHSVDQGNVNSGEAVTASSIRSNLRGQGGKALASPLVLLGKAKRLSPLNLTVHEAQTKRSLLSQRRDEVAEQLGALTVAALEHQTRQDDHEATAEQVEEACCQLVGTLQQVLLKTQKISKPDPMFMQDALIDLLTSSESPALEKRKVDNAPVGLSPPSRLSIVWPRLVVYPALLLFSLRLASNNQEVIRQTIADGKETVRGFFRNWVISPIKDLLDTIRGGDMKEESGGIVTKEGRKADLESLERMVTQYAVEKGQISSEDVTRSEALRRKVREGDLDVVMRAYEDQLRSPLKSLTMGSLPRLLLIQVQKAKYDLAVAMSGIDHLLQSQALLFGAVGIAPAMGILWVSLKSIKYLFSGRNDNSAQRGKQKENAWESMRRIDKLLTTSGEESETNSRSYGHILLELDSLRRIGTNIILPGKKVSKKNKKVKGRVNDFIQDIRELEVIATQRVGQNSVVTRKAAVERMWRCWSSMFVVQF
ncbi:unnamed protein product [Sympodiomycopsis kandeliae]